MFKFRFRKKARPAKESQSVQLPVVENHYQPFRVKTADAVARPLNSPHSRSQYQTISQLRAQGVFPNGVRRHASLAPIRAEVSRIRQEAAMPSQRFESHLRPPPPIRPPGSPPRYSSQFSQQKHPVAFAFSNPQSAPAHHSDYGSLAETSVTAGNTGYGSTVTVTENAEKINQLSTCRAELSDARRQYDTLIREKARAGTNAIDSVIVKQERMLRERIETVKDFCAQHPDYLDLISDDDMGPMDDIALANKALNSQAQKPTGADSKSKSAQKKQRVQFDADTKGVATKSSRYAKELKRMSQRFAAPQGPKSRKGPSR